MVASNPNTPIRILEEIGRGYDCIKQSEQKYPFYFLEMLVSNVVPPEFTFEEKIVKRFLTENPEGLSVLLELFAQEREMFSPSCLFVFSHSQVPPRRRSRTSRRIAARISPAQRKR